MVQPCFYTDSTNKKWICEDWDTYDSNHRVGKKTWYYSKIHNMEHKGAQVMLVLSLLKKYMPSAGKKTSFKGNQDKKEIVLYW